MRGHYPAEIDPLVAALGIPDARILLAPYFGDGGRVTVDGVHHLRRGDALVPVAETEFAKDPVFGYRSSDLRDWVRERAGVARGARPREVRVLTLDAIRGDGPDAVRDALLALPDGGVLAVDAAAERDIEVVALGALLAEQTGLPVVGRTAASYVRARAGLPTVLPLGPHEIDTGRPGLVVVGSRAHDHDPAGAPAGRSTKSIMTLELAVSELLAEDAVGRQRRVATLAAAADQTLRAGVTPVIVASGRSRGARIVRPTCRSAQRSRPRSYRSCAPSSHGRPGSCPKAASPAATSRPLDWAWTRHVSWDRCCRACRSGSPGRAHAGRDCRCWCSLAMSEVPTRCGTRLAASLATRHEGSP